MIEKYFEKQKSNWERSFKTTNEMINPNHLRIYFDSGIKREYLFQEKLTETMKKQFPETLFVVSFRILENEKIVSKSYGLFYKIDKIYGGYLHMEQEGVLMENPHNTLWSYNEDFTNNFRIEVGDDNFSQHEPILQSFKDTVFDLNEYRLLTLTGVIK